jgi:hypothetical protein
MKVTGETFSFRHKKKEPKRKDIDYIETLEEAYLYVKEKISSWESLCFVQDVQVYPTNSTFILTEY